MANDGELQSAEIPVSAGLGPDVVISPDTLSPNRLRPRQVRTRKWPVLDAFGAPEIDLNTWEFEVSAWWNQCCGSVGKSSNACRASRYLQTCIVSRGGLV
jgi:hypothetical protein